MRALIIFIFFFLPSIGKSQSIDSCYYAPNISTPDCDCFGCDLWLIYWVCEPIDQYKMTIYNRWGEVVFESDDPKEAWNTSVGNDGQAVKDGVYVWIMTGQTTYDADLDGVVEYENLEVRGHVTVLR